MIQIIFTKKGIQEIDQRWDTGELHEFEIVIRSLSGDVKKVLYICICDLEKESWLVMKSED